MTNNNWIIIILRLMANRGQSFVASLSEFLKNRLKIAILKFSIISAGEVGVGAVNTTGQTWLIITVVCGFVGWQKIMNRFLKKYIFSWQ